MKDQYNSGKKMKNKKVLVCGATGFIGRNIAEYLALKDNLEVSGTYFESLPLENDGINMIDADLTNKRDVENVLRGQDIVIQAAATTSGAKDIRERPYLHVTDNAIMNALLFRQAFEQKISQLMFMSCTVMYQSGEKPVKESDFNPSLDLVPSYFGVAKTKLYNEDMCKFFAGIGQTKFMAIRHSNIYGPYDKFDLEKSHVFGATLTKVMQAKDEVKVWGTGEEERDLLYVSDLVDFVELALDNQRKPFELYNIGYGSSIPVKNLVEKIILHSGKSLKVSFDTSKPTIKTKLSLDCTLTKEHYGWEPKVSLDEGIKRTLEWYRREIKL